MLKNLGRIPDSYGSMIGGLAIPLDLEVCLSTCFLGFTYLKFNGSPLKSYLPKRKVVFQPLFFRGYVKLRECIIPDGAWFLPSPWRDDAQQPDGLPKSFIFLVQLFNSWHKNIHPLDLWQYLFEIFVAIARNHQLSCWIPQENPGVLTASSKTVKKNFVTASRHSRKKTTTCKVVDNLFFFIFPKPRFLIAEIHWVMLVAFVSIYWLVQNFFRKKNSR